MTTPRIHTPDRRQALGAMATILMPATARAEQPRRPLAVAFDVIGTLFNIAPAGDALREAGVPKEKLDEWYARLSRDAGALNATGVYKPFREVAAGTLGSMLDEAGVKPVSEKVEAFVTVFSKLPAYPDVAPAFGRLADANVRVIALTNGSAEATKKLLKAAKLAVERVVSIDEVKKWKPAREVYLHAVEAMKLKPGQLALVAAHDWDIHGAGRAGLVTGYVARKKGYNAVLDQPTVSGATLKQVIDGLLAGGAK